MSISFWAALIVVFLIGVVVRVRKENGVRFSLTNDKIAKTAQECDELIDIAILFSTLVLAE